ncbi:putative signal peptide-containing protein [Botrytis fragariae]|uniref:Putative signal peptide-containing protein n=1 Tax=Botrytis fragariae TaxID=1964551 RepID=A0A8H6AL46_9HELO|nr:putative signal peptide-containing protein [Botrytis fragariae]KAF5869487.1 putative signal peptide-containing protein [Botrytis fragariae]
MQFSTITFPILALFLTNTLAMPSSPNTNVLDSRSDSCYSSCSCGTVVPACLGAKVVGQTKCRCDGQAGTCDVVMCPDLSLKQVLVCGQEGTGCVWV